jgi:pimeloyl-ACP methyl ester carboxylesterase
VSKLDPKSVPLVLFSGLGADDHVFWHQLSEFPKLTVMDWLVPLRGESLAEYAARYSELIRTDILKNQVTSDVVIGGLSFGGIVALEVAKHVKPDGVVLLASARRPTDLPLRIRFFRPLRFLGPLARVIVMILQLLAVPFAYGVARRVIPYTSGVLRQVCRANSRVVAWSICQIWAWDDEPLLDCSVYQIHGDQDFVIVNPTTKREHNEKSTPSTAEIIPEAGHLVTITHPKDVADFLNRSISGAIEEKQSTRGKSGD